MNGLVYAGGEAALVAWKSAWQSYCVALARDSYQPNARQQRITQVSEIRGLRQELVNRSVAEHGPAENFTRLYLADNVTFAVKTNEPYRWIIVFRAGKTDADSQLITAIDMRRNVPLRGLSAHTILWCGAERTGVVAAFSHVTSPTKGK